MRLNWSPCVAHDCSNYASLAAKDAGFQSDMFATTFLLNFEHGPHKTCQRKGKMQ